MFFTLVIPHEVRDDHFAGAPVLLKPIGIARGPNQFHLAFCTH